jgi:hypothetical protein
MRFGNRYMVDAQQALGFVTSQTSYIEREVVQVQYPDIQYPRIVPVDTSANEWAKSVTYFSMDKVGKAGWFHHFSKDTHIADVERNKFETTIEMAEVGYRWSIEEIGQAMMIPGMNLPADRAEAARRAYEEFVDDIALNGDDAKNFSGILDYPGINTVIAAVHHQTGTEGTGTGWEIKTADEILADINDALTGIYVDTLQVELADTLLLPIAAMALLATRRLNDLNSQTILSWLIENNIYTFQTKQPLTIIGVRGLETIGTGGTGRMVAYRKSPQVLKMHIPMTHRFMPVWQTGPLVFDVPGIFRLGGLEIRRPGSVRYVDGILQEAYE